MQIVSDHSDDFFLGLACLLSISPADAAIAVVDTSSPLSNYIVQVRKPTDKDFATPEDLDAFHGSFLPTTAASSNEEHRIVHSYQNVVFGFAAKLTAEESDAIREKDSVLYVRPEKVLSLHTTHTPDFLGLHQGVGFWKDLNLGKGMIIGVLDSGISPDHPSFSDKEVPLPPAKWKGRCDFNGTSCNNKLIGVRLYTGLLHDDVGHGTHIVGNRCEK
ncbi:hypothetical protein NL676_010251 [Syzygium grande]|nr:hypothetical protein NL676_010251 [Syzygium grande]